MLEFCCFPFCRLASTPAMFNSTLTEDDVSLCPVDGSIMITGISLSSTYSHATLVLVLFLKMHHIFFIGKIVWFGFNHHLYV